MWKPVKVKYIDMIEAVQRRCTRQLPGFSDLTYPERLKKLNLPTLSYRRIRGDMIETYKLLNEECYDPRVSGILTEVVDGNTRGHSKKLFMKRAETGIRKNVFSIRVVKLWNSLPENIVSAPNVNTFKNRFDKYMEDQEVMFNDYKADIMITSTYNTED